MHAAPRRCSAPWHNLRRDALASRQVDPGLKRAVRDLEKRRAIGGDLPEALAGLKFVCERHQLVFEPARPFVQKRIDLEEAGGRRAETIEFTGGVDLDEGFVDERVQYPQQGKVQ